MPRGWECVCVSVCCRDTPPPPPLSLFSLPSASLAKELLSGHPRAQAWLQWLLDAVRAAEDVGLDTLVPAVNDAVRAVHEVSLLFEDAVPSYPRPLLLRIANLYSAVYVSALLHYGAPAAKDFTGRTPLHVAASGNNAVAAALLCRAGHLSDVKDKTGATAWAVAAAAGHRATLDALAHTCSDAVGKDASAAPDGAVMHPFRHDPPLASVHGLQSQGGWSVQPPNGAATGLSADFGLDAEFCDIEQVPARALTSADFFRRFYAKQVPVVVRGDAKDWKMMAAWRRESFVRQFGDRLFSVGHIPYPTYFGDQPQTHVTVADMVRCMMDPAAAGCASTVNASTPLYVFERSGLDTITPELLSDFPPVSLASLLLCGGGGKGVT